ncbi:MAG: bifunctional metallophosphatase/5'-nucleotidase, partial [Chloroflexi bacterium]|nr:bifunctional metallophosphatase/5'-nucleotidase [Chloroflexota bacterium]
RLMQPYVVLNVDGYDIMFIGIITEAVLKSLRLDTTVGTFVDLEDAATEVGKICNAYKDQDIDLTVLLTHIGFDSDRQLAEMLDPSWGVDLIIGGHSHTVLDQPAFVNNVLIAQAGTGTDQVGRFDIEVDDATNRITAWKWRLVPIDSSIAEPDQDLLTFIDSFKAVVDEKYGSLLARFVQPLTHPHREIETSLGNLVADILAERSGSDLVLAGSGAIRGDSLGPLVTLGDLYRVFPYADALTQFTVTGAQLKRLFGHIMRIGNRDGEGECFQVNRGVRAVWDDRTQTLQSLDVKGAPVADATTYTVLLQGYHYKNADKNLGLSQMDLSLRGAGRLIATSARDVLEEYMRAHQNLNAQVEGRLVYLS